MICFARFFYFFEIFGENNKYILITKVSVHVKISGWGSRYLIVLTLFHSIAEAFNVDSTIGL